MLTNEKTFAFTSALLLLVGVQIACGQRLTADRSPEKTAVLQGEARLNYPGANANFGTHNYPIKVVATNPEMIKRHGYAVVGQTAPRHEYSMRVEVPDSGQIVLHAYYDHPKFPPAIAEPAEVSVSDGQEKEVPNFTVNFVDHPQSSSIEGGAGSLVGVMSIVRYYYRAASYDERVGTVEKTIQRLEQLEGWPPSAQKSSLAQEGVEMGDYRYLLTDEKYDSESQDIPSLIEQKYGSEAELADWSNLTDQLSSSRGRLLTFLDEIGMVEQGSDAFVRRGRKRFYGRNRHYFMSRHDGNVPGNYLVHDEMHSNAVSLGSWPTAKKALVRIPE